MTAVEWIYYGTYL